MTDVKVLTKDYIEVVVAEVYQINSWLYNHDIDTFVYLMAIFYDSSLTTISKDVMLDYMVGLGAWEEIKGWLSVPEGAAYMRIQIWGNDSGAGAYMFIDEVSIQKIPPETAGIHYKLEDMSAETTKDTYYGKSFFSGIFNNVDYLLSVTDFDETATGGQVTLDVTIEGYDEDLQKWEDVVSFTQVVCASGASNVTAQEIKKVSGGNLWKVRTKSVLAGAGTPRITFKVGATLKK